MEVAGIGDLLLFVPWMPAAGQRHERPLQRRHEFLPMEER